MSNSPSPALFSRLRTFLPLLIFLLALGIRLIGIGWGLPNAQRNHSLHPDEPVNFLYAQSVRPTSYPWVPATYSYGTLFLLIERVVSDVTASYTGGPKQGDEDSEYAYQGRCILAGRLISALAGAGMALAIYLMVRRILGDIGGASAGLLLGFAPSLVVHSRFMTPDILAAFFLTMGLYYALKLIPSEQDSKLAASWKCVLFSALFIGLSTSTKYTGILGLAPLLALLAILRPEQWALKGCAAVATCLVVFGLTTPGIFADSSRFWKGFTYEMAHTSQGHGLVFEGTTSGFLYHLSNMFVGVGFIVTVIGIGGLIAAIVKRHPWAIALGLFFLLYFALIGRAEVKFMRYTFPLYIALAAGFGYAVGRMRERGGWGHIGVGLAILGIGGVVDSGGLRGAATYSYWMVLPDVRDSVGKDLISRAGLSNQAVGLVDDPWYWSPTLYKNIACPRFMDYSRYLSEARNPRVVRYVAADGSRADWDSRLVTEAKPEYIAYSSFEYSIVNRLKGLGKLSPDAQVTVQRATEFFSALEKGYKLEAQYGTGTDPVEDMMYVQPTLWVWKRADLP